MIGYALIAPRIKVMYVPTTKVACSTLKLLVSQIEGSYHEAASRQIITPNISQEQTIHNYRVHGLKRMFELSPKQQWEVGSHPVTRMVACCRVARSTQAGLFILGEQGVLACARHPTTHP
jgi:hypothetical protein